MRVLVTGSNGLLGRAVVSALNAEGHQAFGIDAVAAAEAPCPTIVLSLADPHAIHRAFDRFDLPDAVVHLANHTNSQVASAETVLRENLAFNTSVFLGSLQAGVTRLVFASSIQAMLGGIEHWKSFDQSPPLPPAFPISERTPAAPSNAYGLSKLITEQMLAGLTAGPMGFDGAAAVSVRLPFLLSERSFARNLSNPPGMPDYRWGGCEAFAYLHVDDAGSVMARAATHPGIEGHRLLWAAAPDYRPHCEPRELLEAFYADVPGAAEAFGAGVLHDCSTAEELLGWKATRTLREARAKADADPS